MVSFSCEACGDILTKKKLDPHRSQCRQAQYTCLDCQTTFRGVEYRAHTSCISEAQKYQGKLYKEPKKKGSDNNNNTNSNNESKTSTGANSQALVPSKPAMDAAVSAADNRVAIVDAPPRAPSPPPGFNVFDFLVTNSDANSAHPLDSPPSSPSSSEASSSSDEEESDPDSMDTDEEEEEEEDPVIDAAEAAREYMKQELLKQGYAFGGQQQQFEQFQSYTQYPPSPAGQSGQFETPAPRGHHRNISTTSVDSAAKESTKKRKRGQPEDLDLSSARAYRANGDVVMTDVPAPLHSGLTGGLNRLLSRPELPPSPPDLDGSPHSPLKRSKHAKLDDKRSTREKEKLKTIKEKEREAKKTKTKDATTAAAALKKDKKISEKTTIVKDPKTGQWVRRRVRKELPSTPTIKESHSDPPSEQEQPARKQLKAIEYNPTKDTDADDLKATPQNAMVVHSKKSLTRAENFLAAAIKDGDDQERGISLNRALKRYGKTGKKKTDEKELWKVLRVRKNERGEMVLFVDA